ncbi:MAG TPA: lysylphosphatidylglycerol synthase domain-containing protein, partial [Gemmatimonadaceae bacterium]|nr:lysylphosphatidylglycerol synthase domain-containing protein [Gemmatimonadaceae bacterium]
MGQSVESRGVSRRAQLLFFAAGVTALAILVIRANPQQLVNDVRDAGWTVPAIVGVYGVVYVLNTIAWRLTMIEPPRMSFGRAWIVNVAAFAINYLTPFASIGGEPFKIVAASQWMGTRNGTASVLNYRLVH